MKIGIDLINLNLSNLGGGLGRYGLQLIYGLAKLDNENEYTIFINAELAGKICIDNPRFHLKIVKTPHRRYAPWNQVYFALHRKQLKKLDLLHSPVTPSPMLIFGAVKTVVTIHDLAWEFFPDTFRRIGVAWWSVAWPRSLKQSVHIIADSESTKQDVVKFFKTPKDKIAVIYPYFSFHSMQSPSGDSDAFKRKYNLPEKYILSVGISHKRKNLGSLIKAFKILKNEKNIPHRLVLTGPRGWGSAIFVDEIQRLNLEDDVIFTGSVPGNDLKLIYEAADVFVFPSLYEGFGYPPLEAMVCGTPVIVANNSSLPEVVGQAGLYIDPLNTQDIADKIVQIISSPSLAQELKSAGFKQSKKFTMEKMIKEYINVYENACRINHF
ncbi:MAG: glycosyltransferase family 1 protein [Candidatus Omnitrophica bacterium]|nr:glycosyltransferase family 1 protein [Candidatus Omnitrophota bacterium]